MLSKLAKESIIKVVTYPGGWLVDDEVDEDESNEGLAFAFFSTNLITARLKQLDTLRRLCIPSLFFLLHRVLYESEELQERYWRLVCHSLTLFSLLIADVVADEHQKLYSVFTPVELGRLLTLLRQSCISVMENITAQDPLGYHR